MTQGKRILRTPEAGVYVGLAATTLEKMRIRGDGPKFIRLTTRAVGYTKEDLDLWLEERRSSSTSEGVD